MERLSGLDAAFLYLESRTNHLHVAGVGVFDGPDMPGGYSFENVCEAVAAGLSSIPRLRMRIRHDLFRLRHPMWVDDPAFSLENHVMRVAMESGVDLPDDVAEHLAHPLPRDRPLWQVVVFEAEDSDSVAVMVKAHHAALDGVSAAAVMQKLFGSGRAAFDPADLPVERQPAPGELTVRALASAAQLPRKYAELVRGTSRGGSGSAPAAIESGERVKRKAPDHPKTIFNRPLSKARSVSFASLDLDLMQDAATKANASLNDVLLSTCAGGIRSYLKSLSELPEEPLLALVPVSLRRERSDGTLGNKLTATTINLRTDISGPARRLRVLAGSSKAGRGSAKPGSGSGGPDVVKIADVVPPTLVSGAAQMYSRLGLSRLHAPLVNVLISNVPGPEGMLDVAGAPVHGLFPFGPIVDGIGLNITAMSYDGLMHLGILGDETALAEPDELARLIEADFDKLVK